LNNSIDDSSSLSDTTFKDS